MRTILAGLACLWCFSAGAQAIEPPTRPMGPGENKAALCRDAAAVMQSDASGGRVIDLSQGPAYALRPARMWGLILRIENPRFVMGRRFVTGGIAMVACHGTLILEGAEPADGTFVMQVIQGLPHAGWAQD